MTRCVNELFGTNGLSAVTWKPTANLRLKRPRNVRHGIDDWTKSFLFPFPQEILLNKSFLGESARSCLEEYICNLLLTPKECVCLLEGFSTCYSLQDEYWRLVTEIFSEVPQGKRVLLG